MAIATPIRMVCDFPLNSLRATNATLSPVVSSTESSLMITSPPIPKGRFPFTPMIEPWARAPAPMIVKPADWTSLATTKSTRSPLWARAEEIVCIDCSSTGVPLGRTSSAGTAGNPWLKRACGSSRNSVHTGRANRFVKDIQHGLSRGQAALSLSKRIFRRNTKRFPWGVSFPKVAGKLDNFYATYSYLSFLLQTEFLTKRVCAVAGRVSVAIRTRV
jgi:hypothetical protein